MISSNRYITIEEKSSRITYLIEEIKNNISKIEKNNNKSIYNIEYDAYQYIKEIKNHIKSVNKPDLYCKFIENTINQLENKLIEVVNERYSGRNSNKEVKMKDFNNDNKNSLMNKSEEEEENEGEEGLNYEFLNKKNDLLSILTVDSHKFQSNKVKYNLNYLLFLMIILLILFAISLYIVNVIK